MSDKRWSSPPCPGSGMRAIGPIKWGFINLHGHRYLDRAKCRVCGGDVALHRWKRARLHTNLETVTQRERWKWFLKTIEFNKRLKTAERGRA